jgi:hypothetical protein
VVTSGGVCDLRITVAASSPAWFTRRAEARKARCSGVIFAMGFEVGDIGAGSGGFVGVVVDEANLLESAAVRWAVMVAVEAQRFGRAAERMGVVVVLVTAIPEVACRRAAAVQALHMYGDGIPTFSQSCYVQGTWYRLLFDLLAVSAPDT